jgi:hypothetical protein
LAKHDFDLFEHVSVIAPHKFTHLLPFRPTLSLLPALVESETEVETQDSSGRLDIDGLSIDLDSLREAPSLIKYIRLTHQAVRLSTPAEIVE